MHKLSLALAGAALLALGCDPTQKKDFHCSGTYDSTLAACTQFHITDAEALVADPICGNNHGTWGSGACPADLSSHAQIPGACVVPAGDYSLSGTNAVVYFYDPVTPTAAEAACTSNGGTWHP